MPCSSISRGKTFYNAGLATSRLFFAPCICFFFVLVYKEHLASAADWIAGVALEIGLNAMGILKIIGWLADRNTDCIFEQPNLLPADRHPEN